MGYPVLNDVATECLLTALEALDIASQQIDDPQVVEDIGHAAILLASILDMAGNA